MFQTRTFKAALWLLALTPLLVMGQDGPPRGGGRGGPPGGRDFRPPPHPVMAALDADRDGELSAEEIAGAVEALKKADTNGDGKLSGDEIRPPRPMGGPGGRGPGRGPGPGGPPRE